VLPWVVVGAGCAMTTTMREGPAKAAAQLATLDSEDTIVDEIDGKNVLNVRADPNAKSVYLLPPGPHVVGVSLRKRPGALSVTIFKSDYIRVCLLAEAGHHYTTAARVAQSTWELKILDRAHGEVPITCDRARIFPVAPLSSDPPGSGETPAPVAPPPSPPAEAPSVGREIIRLWSKDDIARLKGRPFVDVVMSLGWAFGGDDVVRAQLSNGGSQSLAAGRGPFVRAGAMVTPLWLAADRIGFGAGADVALKFDNISASNGDVSFTRYPASFTLHTLARISPIWYVLLAGGVEKDLGISLSGTGVASGLDGSPTSRIGEIGRLGIYWADTDAFAVMLGLEYTKLTYDAPGGSIRANSMGFSTTLTWRPF